MHVPLAPFASTVAGSAVQYCSPVLYVCIRFVWALEYCVVLLRTCAGITAGLWLRRQSFVVAADVEEWV